MSTNLHDTTQTTLGDATNTDDTDDIKPSDVDHEAIQNPVFAESDDRTKEMKNKLDEWIGDLIDETEETINSEEFQKWLDIQSHFHQYSFRNILLIKAQYPEATRVASSGAWEDLNRHPKSEAKAIWIRYPKKASGRICPDCETTAEYDPIAEERKSDQSAAENHSECSYDTDPSEWETGNVVYSYGSGWVFDVTQTAGEPLPDAPERPEAEGENAAEVYTALKALAEDKYGFEVEEVEELPGAYGTSDGNGTIKVRSRDNLADQARTLIHEMTHELIHDRAKRAELDNQTLEVEAESAAYVVCRGVGFEADGSSMYLAQFGKDSPETLANRCDRISKVSRDILNELK